MPVVTGIAGVFYILILLPLILVKTALALFPTEFHLYSRAATWIGTRFRGLTNNRVRIFPRSEPMPFVLGHARSPSPGFKPTELPPFIDLTKLIDSTNYRLPEVPPFVVEGIAGISTSRLHREMEPFWEKE